MVCTQKRFWKGSKKALLGLAVCAAVGALSFARTTSAATIYWDTTSPIATAGLGTTSGTWGSDLFWTTSSGGSTAGTGSQSTSADDVYFNGASGTVTVTGNQAASSINFATQNTNIISGGTITLGGSGTANGIYKTNGNISTINSNIELNGTINAFTISFTGSNGIVVGGNITGLATSGTQTITTNAAGTSAGDISLNGIISDGSGGGKVALVIANSTTLPQNVTVLAGANTFTGGLTLNSGRLTLNNNAALGGAGNNFTINGGTLDVASAVVNTNNVTQSWNADFTFVGTNTLDLGPGTVTLGGSRTITVSASTLTVGGAITDGASTFGLTKVGTGTLVLKGSNTYDGVTTISRGILRIDFSSAADGATNLINSANTLVLSGGGGVLELNGKSTAGASINSQAFATRTFTSGAAAIRLTSGTNNTVNFDLGTVTRNNNLTLDLTKPTSGNITISNANTNGIIAPWVTWNGYSDYAVNSGGNVAALNVANSLDSTWTDPNGNYTRSSATTLTASRAINTLRYTGGSGTIGLAGFDLTTNGILHGGSANNLTISSTGGSVVIGSSNELVLLGKFGIIISAPVKSTASGQTITLGANSTIATNLVSLTGGLSTTASGVTFVVNGNNQNVFSGALTGTASTITLSGPGNLTVGAITGASAHSFDVNAPTGGNFTFTGPSTYTGSTTLTAGTLTFQNTTGAASFLGNSGTVYLKGGTVILPKNNNVATVNNPFEMSGTDSVNVIATGTGANYHRYASSSSLTLSGTPTITYGITPENGVNGGGLEFNFASLVLNSGVNFTLAGITSVSSSRGATTSITSGVTLTSVTSNSNVATITNNVTNGGGGSAVGQASVVLSGVFAGGAAGQTLTLAGSGHSTISNLTAGTNNPGIVVNTTGTVWFTGTNTYTGGTTINAGTIRADTTNAMPNGGIVTINAGTFEFRNSQEIAGLAGSGGLVTNNSTTNYTLTLSGTGNYTYGGSISPTTTARIALTKTGAGTQTLSSTNTYIGATTINGGTLLINGTQASAHTVGGASASGTPTLGGIGTINAAITLNSASGGAAGRITGGNIGTIGTLNGSSTLTFNSGSIAYFDVNPTSADRLAGFSAQPTWNSGQVITINYLPGTYSNTTWDITTWLGGTSVSGANLTALNSALNITGVATGGTTSLTTSAGKLILNLSGVVAAANFTFTDTSAVTLNVLRNSSGTSAGKTISNSGGTGDASIANTNSNLTVSGTLTGILGSGGTSNLTLTPTSTGTYGQNSGTVTVTPNSGGSNVISTTVNVGQATADRSNSTASFGTALTGNVAAAGSYANLASQVTATTGSGGAASLGTEAIIVAGYNNGGSTDTVSMAWRTRTVGESDISQPTQKLYSDVVRVTGMTTGSDIFALQMNYVYSGANESDLKLGWLNGSTWVNAILGNTTVGASTIGATQGYLGSWSTFEAAYAPGGTFDSAAELQSFLGSYGVDTSGNTVWALLNHNSDFAVIPEPTSLGLLGLGAIGLLARRRRNR